MGVRDGEGKTEFVKNLGKTLDRKVLVVKGSDLLSKWVGESEQNIAKAFHRAEAEHAILFFDEVDGLVQSRERAHASWEVTQVNELLRHMENFDGVMIAATNFRKNLDPAIMRRFTFKLEFDYLDDAGKRIFFEKIFKTSLSHDELEVHYLYQFFEPLKRWPESVQKWFDAEETETQNRLKSASEEYSFFEPIVSVSEKW